MDALELLIQDHRKVASLMEQCAATQDQAQCEQLFTQIKTELEMHTQIEESIVYPAFEEYAELADLVAESYEEHQQVKDLLQQMGAGTAGGTGFMNQLHELRVDVEHHVDEEENELFPKVRGVFDPSDLQMMADQIEQTKQQMQQPKVRGRGTA